MSDRAPPAKSYVLEPGSIDQERLKLAATLLNVPTREALARAGVRPGDRVRTSPFCQRSV
jgi:hypothetical protein